GTCSRYCHCQHRQDEDLCIPESMAVIARTGQSFGRNRAMFRTRPGLEDMKKREAYRLLDLRVTLDLDVRAPPEVVQVGPLLGKQALPAGQARCGQCGHDLVVDGRP